MNLEELWIGDRVLISSIAQVGTFEGVAANGKAVVRYSGKKLLVDAIDIALAPEEKSDPLKILLEEEEHVDRVEVEKITPATVNIDLHIEVLNPSLSNSVPERILSYQIDTCKAFIAQAIKRRLPRVQIIHGKGTGVLKSEVLHLLSLFDEVKYTIPMHDGGAQEVWFR